MNGSMYGTESKGFGFVLNKIAKLSRIQRDMLNRQRNIINRIRKLEKKLNHN